MKKIQATIASFAVLFLCSITFMDIALADEMKITITVDNKSDESLMGTCYPSTSSRGNIIVTPYPVAILPNQSGVILCTAMVMEASKPAMFVIQFYGAIGTVMLEWWRTIEKNTFAQDVLIPAIAAKQFDEKIAIRCTDAGKDDIMSYKSEGDCGTVNKKDPKYITSVGVKQQANITLSEPLKNTGYFLG